MAIDPDAAFSRGDVMRQLAQLRQRVAALETRRTLESASIGRGGLRVRNGFIEILDENGAVAMRLSTQGMSLEGLLSVIGSMTLSGGGSIQVLDDNGDERVRINLGDEGGGQAATFHPNGTPHMIAGFIQPETGDPVQGFLVQDENGQDIFNAFPDPATGKNQFRVWDGDGEQQLATDDNGRGLDRPFLENPMYCNSDNGNAFTTSGSFVTLWAGRLWVTHRNLHVQVIGFTGGDTGEARFLLNGTQLGTTEQFSGAGSTLTLSAGLEIPDTLDDYSFYPIEIQARRTGGAGAGVSVIPYGVTKGGMTL